MIIDFIVSWLVRVHFHQNVAFAIASALALLLLIFVSWLSYVILRRYLNYLSKILIRRSLSRRIRLLIESHMLLRLAHFAPALIIYNGADLLVSANGVANVMIVYFFRRFSTIYMLVAMTWAFSSLLNAIYFYYKSTVYNYRHPLRSYTQVIKLVAWGITFVLVVATIIDKSPWAFLAGLGALSAVLTLIFQESILGFVVSIQASAYDIVRISDWITIPQYHIDGNVIDISINTVRIRNFDKTISTIPITNLFKAGVQNWRGMVESGGRRIKRALYIDMDDIVFCDDKMLTNLKNLDHLKDYIDKITAEISDHNQKKGVNVNHIVNGRQLTNIGLFRHYIKEYLQSHPYIHNQDQGFTFLVRHLQPTEMGLPLELYVFTTSTEWPRYEAIQADIFDHLLATLPIFGLRSFQILSSRVTNKGPND